MPGNVTLNKVVRLRTLGSSAVAYWADEAEGCDACCISELSTFGFHPSLASFYWSSSLLWFQNWRSRFPYVHAWVKVKERDLSCIVYVISRHNNLSHKSLHISNTYCYNLPCLCKKTRWPTFASKCICGRSEVNLLLPITGLQETGYKGKERAYKVQKKVLQ